MTLEAKCADAAAKTDIVKNATAELTVGDWNVQTCHENDQNGEIHTQAVIVVNVI